MLLFPAVGRGLAKVEGHIGALGALGIWGYHALEGQRHRLPAVEIVRVKGDSASLLYIGGVADVDGSAIDTGEFKSSWHKLEALRQGVADDR